MSVPVLRSAHVYPVESLAARACDTVAVEPWGLDGDRRWMLVDKAARAVTQRQQPSLARISAEPSYRGPVDPLFSRPGDMVSLADGYPLPVTTASSLDALNALIAAGDRPEEGPLPMDRFRPDVVTGVGGPVRILDRVDRRLDR